MAYSHTTLAQLKTRLASRLGDSSNVFWLSAELDDYIAEALYTWGSLSAFWRDKSLSMPTVSGTPFYSLSDNSAFAGLTDYTITDADIIRIAQYHLLEPATPTSWSGTDMFTLADLTNVLEKRRNQFLMETGLVLTQTSQVTGPPTIGRVVTADTVMDLRRVVWKDVNDSYTQLWREDEFSLTSYNTGWSVTADTPYAYSVISTPPLSIQVAPMPGDVGTIEYLSVNSGASLDPATGVVLGVPDNVAWVIKWGMLADLLSASGPAADISRAAFCESRYRLGVELCRNLPVVLHPELNGVPLTFNALADMDAGWTTDYWQNLSGAPTDIAVSGDLLALSPVPDGVYSVLLDVVRKAEVPTLDSDFIQVGREHLDAIIDYCEHLAMFKCGGQEFANSLPNADNFLRVAVEYSSHLRAQAVDMDKMMGQSSYETSVRPLRELPRKWLWRDKSRSRGAGREASIG